MCGVDPKKLQTKKHIPLLIKLVSTVNIEATLLMMTLIKNILIPTFQTLSISTSSILPPFSFLAHAYINVCHYEVLCKPLLS